MPGRAFADSFEVSKVDIAAEVLTDGSLHVTESRTFEFDGDCTAVRWPLDSCSDTAQLQVNGVRLTTPQTAEGTADPVDLPSTPFQLAWREGEDAGETAYSVDATRNTVYVFFAEPNNAGETLTVTLDYTVENGVQAYKDVAELEWTYVSDWWEEASADVSLTIALPVPQGDQVASGDTVHAWGHGPSDGTVAVNEDNTIGYQTSLVRSGQYAEAHVVFPVSWLSNLPNDSDAQPNRSKSRLDAALSEEETWSDQSAVQRMTSLELVIACGVLCILLLAWALRTYSKYGREYTPDFTGDYWRDEPDPSVPPAVIGRLWRWNRKSLDDFAATVLDLARKGALLADGEGGYRLTQQPSVADTLTSPIDRAALDLLFRDIAQGCDQLRLDDIAAYGKENPRAFAAAMDAWQNVVSAETNKRNFFDAKSRRAQKHLAVAAALLLLMPGTGGFFLLHHSAQLVFVVPAALALLAIANYLPRRTESGNNLAARCKALRNWLCDLPSLDGELPADNKKREGLMVYACLFNVATSPFVSQLQAALTDAATGRASSTTEQGTAEAELVAAEADAAPSPASVTPAATTSADDTASQDAAR